MSEYWKPDVGQSYWCVQYTGQPVCFQWMNTEFQRMQLEIGNVFRTQSEATQACDLFKSVLLDLKTTDATLAVEKYMIATPKQDDPKMTAEVFYRTECPDDAKIAIVNQDGSAHFGSFASAHPVCGGWVGEGDGEWTRIPCKYDGSDWQNSLIERPAKLPDWCKVGEWVYNTDFHKYIKVVERTHDEVKGKDIHGGVYYADFHFQNTVPARLRPYNEIEMRGLVGMVICSGQSIQFVTGYEKMLGGESRVCVNGHLYNADDLLQNGFTYDTKPCGRLEHLENGEWVA